MIRAGLLAVFGASLTVACAGPWRSPYVVTEIVPEGAKPTRDLPQGSRPMAITLEFDPLDMTVEDLRRAAAAECRKLGRETAVLDATGLGTVRSLSRTFVCRPPYDVHGDPPPPVRAR